MKKIIAWPVVQLLYYIGHGVSCLLNHIPDRWERVGDTGYWFYSTPMQWSMRLNDWAGLKVWK